MSKFKSNPGKCYELTADIDSAVNVPLPIDNSELLSRLQPDCHTYLQLTDGVNCEFVRVELNSSNTGLVLTGRGLDGTTATSYFKGTKAFFVWTDSAMNDFLDCRAETVNEADAPIKIPGYTSSYDEEAGQWCYEPDDPNAASGVSWTIGKTQYTFKDGVITTEAAAGNGLTPGTYNNATVTVDSDCNVVKVEEGNKPLYTPSVCNKCNNCDDTDTP